MDKQECVEVENINPLKVLEMSGISFSMNKVSNQPFEFKEFLPQIIEKGNKLISHVGVGASCATLK